MPTTVPHDHFNRPQFRTIEILTCDSAHRLLTLLHRVSHKNTQAKQARTGAKTMARSVALSLMTLAIMVCAASAQDGILGRAGQALDNAGRNIRNAVDAEVARGQIDAVEREVLARVMRRVEWDKQLVGSTILFQVQPGRAVVLRGSVLSPSMKLRAVELVSNTIGVTTIVDELAVVKDVKIINAKPTVRVIETTAPVTTETKIIVKP
jgi:hyperosmotically inducible periplasmic protein